MEHRPPLSLAGKRVTVMGLGRFGGGAAAVRYAARMGARVTLTDKATEESLRAPLSGLADVPPARLRLGGHDRADFESAEIVIVNPAVPPESDFLRIARESGAVLTSELELALAASPCRVIAVTGTNGKSTTAAMTAHLLRACGRTAWLGGNIGHSLLAELERIQPGDWAVVEVSSFQLQQLGPPRPYFDLMAVTNFTANHLDRHGTLEAYAAAKRRMFDFAERGASFVADLRDPALRRWFRPPEELQLNAVPPAEPDRLPPLPVPGTHNRQNAAVAIALARLACRDARGLPDAMASYPGLDHRLRPVPCGLDRRCLDDSASTTPESTIAALDAIPGPVWLLAGGKNKGMDMEPLLAAIRQKTAGAAFFGSVAREACERLISKERAYRCVAVDSLEKAFDWALSHSREGDAIVLSPGFASTDQFANYEERAEAFVRVVRRRQER